MQRPGRGAGSLPTAAGYGNGGGSPYGGYGGGYGSGGNNNSYESSGGGGGGSPYGGYTGGGAAYGAASDFGSSHVNGGGGSSYKEKQREKHRGRNSNHSWPKALTDPWVWTVAVASLFALLAMRFKIQQQFFLNAASAKNYQEVLHTLHRHTLEQDQLRNEVRTAKEAYRKAIETASNKESDFKKLKAKLTELQSHHDELRESEFTRKQTREQAWKEQVELLQKATTRESRRAAIDKYVLLFF